MKSIFSFSDDYEHHLGECFNQYKFDRQKSNYYYFDNLFLMQL